MAVDGPARMTRREPRSLSTRWSEASYSCSHHRLAAPGAHGASSSGAQMKTGSTGPPRATAASRAGLSPSLRSSRNQTIVGAGVIKTSSTRRLANGAFETDRAIAAGKTVRREIRSYAGDATRVTFQAGEKPLRPIGTARSAARVPIDVTHNSLGTDIQASDAGASPPGLRH